MARILVHACCGPCSIMPTRLLATRGHEVDVFYANSNIAPVAEYEKRLVELRKYAESQGFSVIEGDYDPAKWEREVAPIGEAIEGFSPALGLGRLEGMGMGAASSAGAGGAGDASDAGGGVGATLDSVSDDGVMDDISPSVGAAGGVGTDSPLLPQSVAELLDDERRRERCRACYRLRLEEAAAVAVEGGYDELSTTLAVSPYQFTGIISEELERAASQAGIAAHFEDWRPYYGDATRISRELGMYRQNYCGCRFSVAEGEATRAFIKKQRRAAKEAKAAMRAAEEAALAQRRADKQAYADKRARERAIRKQLRRK